MASPKYTTARTVIESGRYELAQMLDRLDTVWLQGDVTDGERAELVALAQERADQGRAFASLEERMAMAEGRISALEAKVDGTETGGGPGEPDGAPDMGGYGPWHEVKLPEDTYALGAKIVFRGRKYTCVQVPCNYSPADWLFGWRDDGEAPAEWLDWLQGQGYGEDVTGRPDPGEAEGAERPDDSAGEPGEGGEE